MINQKMVDWIKGQEAKGYSQKQIYSHLTQHGYNPNDVNDAINSITTSPINISPVNPKIKPEKSSSHILPFIIIGIMFVITSGGAYYYYIVQDNTFSLWNKNMESDINTVPALDTTKDLTPDTEPANTPIQNEQPTNINQDSNCDTLPNKLESCTNHTCRFIHPLTGETMTKEILGIINSTCHYIEQMPNNGQMECNYTENMRKAVAKYYIDVTAAESVGTEINMDLGSGETKTNYTIDGKETSNPIEEAIITGQCVIYGY